MRETKKYIIIVLRYSFYNHVRNRVHSKVSFMLCCFSIFVSCFQRPAASERSSSSSEYMLYSSATPTNTTGTVGQVTMARMASHWQQFETCVLFRTWTC